MYNHIYIYTYVSMYILLHIFQYMYCILHTITLLHTVLLCIIQSLIIHPRPWCCSAWEVVVDRVEYFDRPKSWRHSLPSMDVYGWIWENRCLRVTWKPCFFFSKLTVMSCNFYYFYWVTASGSVCFNFPSSNAGRNDSRCHWAMNWSGH
jgi:hypothetical protein